MVHFVSVICSANVRRASTFGAWRDQAPIEWLIRWGSGTDIRSLNIRSSCPYTVSAPFMNQPRFQRLIATLCLVAFGFGQTVFASIGVRCTDASGTSRFEYACLKSSQGACLTPCAAPGAHADSDDHASDPVQPTPCEDEPLGTQATAAKVIPSGLVIQPVFAAVVVAILWEHWSFSSIEPTISFQLCRDRDRPPDALSRLRSVILLV